VTWGARPRSGKPHPRRGTSGPAAATEPARCDGWLIDQHETGSSFAPMHRAWTGRLVSAAGPSDPECRSPRLTGVRNRCRWRPAGACATSNASSHLPKSASQRRLSDDQGRDLGAPDMTRAEPPRVPPMNLSSAVAGHAIHRRRGPTDVQVERTRNGDRALPDDCGIRDLLNVAGSTLPCAGICRGVALTDSVAWVAGIRARQSVPRRSSGSCSHNIGRVGCPR
jgi:hypothetical protein